MPHLALQLRSAQSMRALGAALGRMLCTGDALLLFGWVVRQGHWQWRASPLPGAPPPRRAPDASARPRPCAPRRDMGSGKTVLARGAIPAALGDPALEDEVSSPSFVLAHTHVALSAPAPGGHALARWVRQALLVARHTSVLSFPLAFACSPARPPACPSTTRSVHHFDLQRLEPADHATLASVGWFDALAEGAVIAEWASRIPAELREEWTPRLEAHLLHPDERSGPAASRCDALLRAGPGGDARPEAGADVRDAHDGDEERRVLVCADGGRWLEPLRAVAREMEPWAAALGADWAGEPRV